MKKIFVQVGAGAGDLDSRSNFRDGFTEYVKSIDVNSIEKILLVEPNPLNIPNLTKCWSAYSQAEIHEVGIAPPSMVSDSLIFYYAEEDAPHYQVLSIHEAHVRKHYPNGSIKKIEVHTYDLKSFLDKAVGARQIELLALDIEGVDSEILLTTNWSEIDCKRISFEHLHLGKNFNAINKRLLAMGFLYDGVGIDANGFDLMYKKGHVNFINKFISNIRVNSRCLINSFHEQKRNLISFLYENIKK